MHTHPSKSTTRLSKLPALLFSTCLSLGFLAIASFAQPPSTGTITGRVYSPATSEYLRNAEVQLQGTDRLATTGSDGSFTFTSVPVGSATLSISYTGYNTATVEVNVSAGAANYVGDVVSLDMTELCQLADHAKLAWHRGIAKQEDAKHWRTLLRSRPERPRHRRTTQNTEKCAPPHTDLRSGDSIVMAQMRTLIEGETRLATAI